MAGMVFVFQAYCERVEGLKRFWGRAPSYPLTFLTLK